MSHEHIREALGRATPGPWSYTYGPREHPRVWCDDDDEFPMATIRPAGSDNAVADAHLIANAPTWLAELLAEVDELRNEARAFAAQLGFVLVATEPSATAQLAESALAGRVNGGDE